MSALMLDVSNGDDKKKAKAGTFAAMDLDLNLFKGLNRMGYKAPTPVQRKALPVALAGMDIVCMARTGSGKTCVFLLPMMQKLLTRAGSQGVRGLVLSPTRELAVQTFRFAKDMTKFMDLQIASIIGGDTIDSQFEALSLRPDIIVATPGRLCHHLSEIKTFTLNSVQYLVFDEADRLFEMGFADDLHTIVTSCSKERQTLLFSATMPKQLIQFSRAGLRHPQLIRLDTDTKMSEDLRTAFFLVRSQEKSAALLYLSRKIIPPNQLTIIFVATRHHSEYVHALLAHNDIPSTVIYGAMDQDAREINLAKFRKGAVSFLVVTDLAARGIDLPLLSNVINFHFPASPKLFVHRCGRAARAGRIGFAFSLVESEELGFAVDVHTLLGKRLVVGGSSEREDVELAEAEVQGVLQAEDLVLGCTDPEANNFDAAATLNFPGACNYMMRSCAAIKQAMPSSATGASAPSQCTLSLPKADLRPLAHLPPIRHVPDPGPSIQRWQPPGSVV